MASFHEQFKLAQAELLLKLENQTKEVLTQVVDRLLDYSVVGDPNTWHPAIWPKGYTPGAFKGSWHHSIGAPSSDTSEHIEAQGSTSRMECGAGIEANPFADHFFTNNQPYALLLERGGHSPQTPAGGIVGRTEMDFQGIVNGVVKSHVPDKWKYKE